MSRDKLPCGHPIGWIIRLRDGKRQYKYCWGCIMEKIGMEEIYSKSKIEEEKKIVESNFVNTTEDSDFTSKKKEKKEE